MTEDKVGHVFSLIATEWGKGKIKRKMRKVLVLEDDPSIRSFIVINLRSGGGMTSSKPRPVKRHWRHLKEIQIPKWRC